MGEVSEAERFVTAMRSAFEHGMDPLSTARPRATWVAGGSTGEGDPVVLYRWDGGAPVFGRCWDLEELRSLFDPHDPEHLARCMWESQVDEPPGEGRRLDVGWADGLVADPREVRWLGR